MARPRRLYINSKGKYYYIIDGKKRFVKVPEGMSQKQVQTINIKNIVTGQARRIKRRTGKKVIPQYERKVTKGEDMTKVSSSTGGLPMYIFTPQKKFLSLGDIATKSEDTSDKKIIDLLDKAVPLLTEGVKRLALPAPEQKFMLQDADKDLIDEMITGRLVQLEPAVKALIQQETAPKPPLSQKENLKLIKEEKERVREALEQTRRSREGTPATTPFREDEEDFRPPASMRQEFKDETKVEESKESKETVFSKAVKTQNLTYTRIRKVVGGDWFDTNLPGFKISEIKDLQKVAERLGIDSSGNITNLKKRIKEHLEQIGKGEDGDNGLYNDQIQNIMKKRIKNFVPVVASDQVNSLLNHVGKGDKFFTAVINTDPSHKSGRHWTGIVMDNRDDYPSAEFFDSLAENDEPPEALLNVMKLIARKMNPEKYFKYKFNRLQRQNSKSTNCGMHVMKFIEDRYNGDSFEEASGWKSYMDRQRGKGIEDSKDGESELKPYEKKIKNLYKSYL